MLTNQHIAQPATIEKAIFAFDASITGKRRTRTDTEIIQDFDRSDALYYVLRHEEICTKIIKKYKNKV